MEDGDTESENASRVIQDFVFLCRKIGSINGYFCRYMIKRSTTPDPVYHMGGEKNTRKHHIKEVSYPSKYLDDCKKQAGQ